MTLESVSEAGDVARYPDSRIELWKTDGTREGTVLVENIYRTGGGE